MDLNFVNINPQAAGYYALVSLLSFLFLSFRPFLWRRLAFLSISTFVFPSSSNFSLSSSLFCPTYLFRGDFLSSLRRFSSHESGQDERGRKRALSVTLGAGERRKYTRAWHLILLLFAGTNGSPSRRHQRAALVRVARAVATNFPSSRRARRSPSRISELASLFEDSRSRGKLRRRAESSDSILANNPSWRCRGAHSRVGSYDCGSGSRDTAVSRQVYLYLKQKFERRNDGHV